MKHLIVTLAVCVAFATAGVNAVAGNITGKVTARGAKNAANAVVYIEQVPGKTFQAPSKPEKMDQHNMEFIPHVLPVLVGTTVEFHNGDKVLHNVYSPDYCGGKFNLGTWPQGQSKSFKFTKACTATLLCNVHPEMQGFVVALPTPYFAVTKANGSFEIKDVPAGKYQLKIWHESLKGNPVEVTVPASGSATANFLIKR